MISKQGSREFSNVFLAEKMDGGLNYSTSLRFSGQTDEPDTSSSTPQTTQAKLGPVDTLPKGDVTIASTGDIRGRVFNDINEDGVRQGYEALIAGRTVFIDENVNGLLDEGERSTITDAGGNYVFEDLPAGAYSIRQIVPTNWRQTSPDHTVFEDYLVLTSDDVGGPAYSWTPIDGIGTALTGVDNESMHLVDLPFGFSFFGELVDQVYVSSNGFLGFSGTNEDVNAPLPSLTGPDGMIAAYWDDLTPTDGQIHYYHDQANDRMMFQFTDVSRLFSTTTLLTFQMILNGNGTIEFQYEDMVPQGHSATVGIENRDNVDAVEFSYNTGSIQSFFAMTFTPNVTNFGPENGALDVYVSAGENIIKADFGTIDVSETTGTISGRVWHDYDGDGIYEAPLEPGISDVFVYADLNENSSWDISEPYTYTSAAGVYRLPDLDAGTYSVIANMPTGGWQNWQQTTPVTTPGVSATSVADRMELMRDLSASSSVDTSQLVELDYSIAHAADELIVKIDQSAASTAAVSALKDSLGATVLKTTVTMGIELWKIDGASLQSAVETLNNSQIIEYVELNYDLKTGDVETQLTPDDTRYDELWGLHNTGQTGGTADADIDAPEAWDITTGNSHIVVGVTDTGVDYTHPDLINNMWVNPGEIAGNGIDDDGNGYVDDIYGYDFINGDGDPMDDNSHGTHVAGTIGAEGNNNLGVVGVAQDVSIAALKFLGSDGYGSSFDAALAVEYATMMGFDITNHSWGGGTYNQVLYDAMELAGQVNGQLIIAAAGNNSRDNDAFPFYPSSYDLDNIIAVAATDHNDDLAWFSQWGETSVDLAAPGVNTLSTVLNGGYGVKNGTSMATPHVAGVAALLKGFAPYLSYQQIKDIILGSADPIASLDGLLVSGGRLNAYNALLDVPEASAHSVTVEVGRTANQNNFGFFGGATTLNDLIKGLDGDDVISAQAGDDRVEAGEGNDVVHGDAGLDTLYGEEGDDILFGDDGNDVLYGGVGDDQQFGGAGDDLLKGSADDDLLDGGTGIDTVDYSGSVEGIALFLGFNAAGGFAAGDTLTNIENVLGTRTHDLIIGDNGSNTFEGDLGRDYLNGQGGNDFLYGYNGYDIIEGGAGDDLIEGGRHDDVLTGGTGADIFLMRGITHADTINDFSKTEGDTLWLAEVIRFADLTIEDDGDGNALISWAGTGGPHSVLLIGNDPADVRANWFTWGEYTGPASTIDLMEGAPKDREMAYAEMIDAGYAQHSLSDVFHIQ